MKKIDDLKSVQKLEFDILKVMDTFLKKNDLKYFLLYGTLIGAIRHEGFIPWDDDIDVGMLRSDYERLKKIAQKNPNIDERYRIMLAEDENYPYPFIKVVDTKTLVNDELIKPEFRLSVWVDIFPLDHLPDDPAQIEAILKKSRGYKNILHVGTLRKVAIRNPINLWMKKLQYVCSGGYKGVSKKIDSYCIAINEAYKDSNIVGNIAWSEAKRVDYSLDSIMPLTPHTFVEGEFPVPGDYDTCLRNIYGDYMQIPPEGQRVSHNIDVILRE